jgi:hypothetical protein
LEADERGFVEVDAASEQALTVLSCEPKLTAHAVGAGVAPT